MVTRADLRASKSDITSLLREVHDEAVESRLKRFLADGLHEHDLFEPSWIREKGWTVVLIQDSMNHADAERIAWAGRKLGAQTVYTLPANSESEEPVLETDMTRDGLIACSFNCMLSPYVYVPDNLTFAIFDESDIYYAVAGREEDVVKMTANSRQTSWLMFDMFVEYLKGGHQQYALESIELYRQAGFVPEFDSPAEAPAYW
ncbi:MAG: hypothetical protein AAF772_00185 [Acidobacteriota bacterium]